MRTLLFTFALSFVVAGQLSAQQYKFVDLHTVGTITQSQATSINDSGVVVGMGSGGISGVAGFRWRNGAMQLLPYPSGDTYVFAHGINRSGVICGSANDGSAPARPFRLNGVTYTFPNVPTTQISEAKAIDAFNNIVGYANYVGFNQTHATLWQGYSYTDLGTLGGTLSSASDINDNGEIVGRSTNLSGFTRAFLYRNWTMQDLGVLTGNTHSEANGINNLGSVVGKSVSSSSAPTGFLWQATGGMTALPRPAGSWGAEALAINDSGVIVGDYSPVYNTFRACLWKNGVIVELDTLASIPQGYVLNYASAINNPGEIIGYATLPSGFKHAFMLIPLTLRITYPQSDELILAGESYTIRWHSTGMDSLKIEYSLDSGATYQTVVRNTPATADSFAWNVPDTLSAKCKIRITNLVPSALDHPTQTASESGTFKVKGYRLTRFTWNGDFEAFDLTKHAWQFENSDINMWPPTWWSQFNYTGRDPVTGQNYPPVFVAPQVAAHPKDFIDWPHFVKAFTANACYKDASHRTYSPTALHLWAAVKMPWAGSCFGFSQSSLLAFDRPDEFLQAFPEVGTFQNLHDLPLNANRRNVINQLFEGQHGAQHVQYKRQALQKTVRQTLEDVKRMLSSTTEDHCSISLGVQGKNHSVVPYKLVRDPAVSGKFSLSVYDNYFPTGIAANGSPTVIVFDSLQSLWLYPPLEWGNSAGRGIYLRDPASTYLSPPLIRTGAAQLRRLEFNVTLFSKAASSVIITDTSGNSITFFDSTLVNRIAGAVPIIPDDATFRTPLGYDVPGGRYSVSLSGFIDSVATFAELTPSGLFTYWRSGAANTQTDRLSSGNGIDIGNPDAQTKTINLQAIEGVDSSERVVQILNCPAAQHDSMSISTPDGDPVKFVNRGPQKTYDLNVELAASSGSGKFTHSSVTVPANSTHYIVPHWQDLQHQPVKIYVDFGNNGTIDDSVFVTNQSTDVPFFSTGELPGEFALGQNYPNPFNPSTTIEYAVPARASVELKVVDVLGREVTTLLNEEKPAGAYTVRWNADGMASGVYFYRLKAGDCVQTRKMLLVH